MSAPLASHDHHEVARVLDDAAEPRVLCAQRVLGLHAVGDVAAVGHEPVGGGIRRERAPHVLDPAPLPVLVAEAVADDRGAPGVLLVEVDGRHGLGHVVGVQQVGGRLAQQLVGRVAEDALDRRAEVGDRAGAVDHHHVVARVLDEPPEVRLALRERTLGLHALGDVAGVDHDAGVGRVGGEGARHRLVHAPAPVLVAGAVARGRHLARVRDEVGDGGPHVLEVIGVHRLRRGRAEQLLGLPAEHPLGRWAHVGGDPVRVADQDLVARVLDEAPEVRLPRFERRVARRQLGGALGDALLELLVRVAQRLFGSLARRDVARRGEEARPPFHGDLLDRHLRPHEPPVLVPPGPLVLADLTGQAALALLPCTLHRGAELRGEQRLEPERLLLVGGISEHRTPGRVDREHRGRLEVVQPHRVGAFEDRAIARLRGRERALGGAPLRDVERGADHARRAPVVVQHETRARLQQPDGAVGAHDAELHRIRQIGGERRHARLDHASVAGMHHGHERRVRARRRGLVDAVDAPLLARPPDLVGSEIDLPAPETGELLDEIHLLFAVAEALAKLLLRIERRGGGRGGGRGERGHAAGRRRERRQGGASICGAEVVRA